MPVTAAFRPCGTQGRNAYGLVALKAAPSVLVALRDKTEVALRHTGTHPVWPCGTQGQNRRGW